MSAPSVTLSANTAASFTREAFNAHLARVQHLPAWWLDRKRAAYERFLALPLPKRTDETWRFSNIAGVTLVVSGRVTARDVIDTDRVIATKAAIEKLQESLG